MFSEKKNKKHAINMVTEVKDWGKLAEEYDLSVKDTKGACSAPEEAEGIPPRHVVLETTGNCGFRGISTKI